MITLYYILGKEPVKILDDDGFESLIEFAEENPDCFHSKEFETEKEMSQFIAGLEEAGHEHYSILDEEEAKKVLAAAF